jgi:predicted site-specific integrase-resolvase
MMQAMQYIGVSQKVLNGWCDEGKVKYEVNPESGYKMFSKRWLKKVLMRAKK